MSDAGILACCRQAERLPKKLMEAFRDQRRRSLEYLLYDKKGIIGLWITRCGGCGLLNISVMGFGKNPDCPTLTSAYCSSCDRNCIADIIYETTEEDIKEMEIYLKLLVKGSG